MSVFLFLSPRRAKPLSSGFSQAATLSARNNYVTLTRNAKPVLTNQDQNNTVVTPSMQGGNHAGGSIHSLQCEFQIMQFRSGQLSETQLNST